MRICDICNNIERILIWEYMILFLVNDTFLFLLPKK